MKVLCIKICLRKELIRKYKIKLIKKKVSFTKMRIALNDIFNQGILVCVKKY